MKDFNLNSKIRKNILELAPYVSFRDQNYIKNPIYLDANENPFGEFNRYPDSTHKKLRSKIAEIKGVSPKQIFIGNGSDELLEILIKIFCEPNQHSILMMKPSFSMYEVYAKTNAVKVDYLFLDENFQIKKEEFLEKAENEKNKILFLCSPNNPTGNAIENIEFYIENFNGIVVVDEAYQDFSSEKSVVNLLEKYPNLIVLQTLSKAWGLAGARIGFGMASEEISKWIYTVKSPYNVSVLNQNAALNCLENSETYQKNLSEILNQRAFLNDEFSKIKSIIKVYPTDSNFFLIEFNDVEKVYHKLLENNILVSLRHPSIPNCIRINVGTKEENAKLLMVLDQI